MTLQHGTVSDSGTLSCKVQESDTNADEDFDDIEAAAFADVAGGALVTSGVYVGRLNLAGRKRYIRVVATSGATETALVSALVTLHQARELPVSQVNDLAFNVKLADTGFGKVTWSTWRTARSCLLARSLSPPRRSWIARAGKSNRSRRPNRWQKNRNRRPRTLRVRPRTA